AEYSVFTPVMRTHLGNKPDANHQFYSSNDTLAQFARLTQIHARLTPYTAYCVRKASEMGIPAQRPLFLHYEAESEAWSTQQQYMYGPDLLVAPVIHRGQTSVEVYLPGDDWLHLFGMAPSVVGPVTVTTDSPMGFPAVYYRRNSDFAALFEAITLEFGV
ncbi:Glycoside hydrolase family 31, partial [Trinorchestia longiramus]